MGKRTSPQLPDAGQPTWSLEIEGAKRGPYSIHQIVELLREDEIHVHHRATAEIIGDQWILVQDFIRAYLPQLGAAAEDLNLDPTSPNFRPPPRPADRGGQAPRIPGDETLSLFDALVVAKEKKKSSVLSTPDPLSVAGRFDPKQKAIAAAAAVALVGLVWAIFRKSEPTPTPAAAQNAPAQAPQTPQASAPAAPGQTITNAVPPPPGEPPQAVRDLPQNNTGLGRISGSIRNSAAADNAALERARERNRGESADVQQNSFTSEPDPSHAPTESGSRDGSQPQQPLQQAEGYDPNNPGPNDASRDNPGAPQTDPPAPSGEPITD